MASLLNGKSLTLTLDKVKVQLETYKAYSEGYRIITNQGGTRSGKTYGVIKLLIGLALKEKIHISICSVAFPHLRRGAMRDWRTIMENFGLYDPDSHTKTEQLYHYPNGSIIEFFSVDNALKVRGPGRDVLFVNEANLIEEDTFRQLNLRTRKAVFVDYNPADEFHWIYDNVLTRKDCYFIKSTYKDNPFLPKEQVQEIENLKDVDENYWRIYGEGERGHSEGVIYTHWTTYHDRVSGFNVYGIDFGYNNPTALVSVTDRDQNLYAEEVIYQTHLTNQQLISLMLEKVPKTATIFADAAEPARIEEIRRAGYSNIRPANKNVKEGIDFIKSRKLFVQAQSANFIKELKSYKFKDFPKNEEPVKLNDHLCDALRYAAISLKKPKLQPIPTFAR